MCSEDADKTVALVESCGGTVIAPPVAVDDLGRLAVFTDPAQSSASSRRCRPPEVGALDCGT